MRPTLGQLKDWHKRLFDLTEEMEQTYGPAGDYNTPALDAAVHVALHVAGIEYRDAWDFERASGRLEQVSSTPQPMPHTGVPVNDDNEN